MKARDCESDPREIPSPPWIAWQLESNRSPGSKGRQREAQTFDPSLSLSLSSQSLVPRDTDTRAGKESFIRVEYSSILLLFPSNFLL